MRRWREKLENTGEVERMRNLDWLFARDLGNALVKPDDNLGVFFVPALVMTCEPGKGAEGVLGDFSSTC